jgi:probable HAF family extracellular repeat protein
MSTRWTLAGVSMLLVAVGANGTGVRASADPYTLQDLGAPSAESVALGVNAGGVAVGWSLAAGHYDGFRQVAGALPEVLPPFLEQTVAVGVNDSGQVGGYGYGGDPFVSHPLRFETGGASAADLHTDGVYDVVYAIDAAGRVVGYGLVDGHMQATRWSSGLPTVIGGRPNAPFSAAYGTSETGVVVGGTASAVAGVVQEAFKWVEGTGHTFLPSLGGSYSEARGANAAGEVVGFSTQAGGGDFVAVRWPSGGGAPTALPGMTRAYDINNLGQIVGTGPAADDSEHAFLFDGGVAVDLNTLIDAPDWVLTAAYAVNDAGQIVGEGVVDGLRRGFLLTPPHTADTTAPLIAGVSATPGAIWPANHQIVNVALSVNASDDSGEAPVCAVSDITSSDAADATGDGHTATDTSIVDALHVRVRAERSTPNRNRVYSIKVRCADGAGNASTATGTVKVGK